jgi:molybdenum cofactor cytidylyltransferase
MAANKEVGVEARRDSRIGAVVLAAGKSTRMGEPKQLLLLSGKTVLQETLENVRGAKVSDIVVVLGFAAEAIAQQVTASGIRIVVNEAYQQGMGSSLSAGLAALDPLTDAALIVLADQPFVRSTTLDQIIDQYQQSGAQIVIPTYRGFRGNPVLLDRSVFPELMALSGDIGCRAIFGDHLEGIAKVAVDDIGVLLDIDNKDDLARLQRFGQAGEDRGALIEAADLPGREIPAAEDRAGDQAELIVVGTEPVAQAVARLGKLMRFRVTVVDPLLNASDLPDADVVLNALDFSHLQPASDRYVVIASRGRFDEEAIEQALLATCDYVALVANRKRAQEVRRALELKGQPAGKLATLHVPAGLDIGAKTPEEIALSIMAEIVALRRKAGDK